MPNFHVETRPGLVELHIIVIRAERAITPLTPVKREKLVPLRKNARKILAVQSFSSVMKNNDSIAACK